jgi:hypothetical protein
MVKKKTKKVASKKTPEDNINLAIKMVASMLKKLNDADSWTKADNQKLAQLTKVVNVLVKLMPIAENKQAEKTTLLKEDKEIIKNFLGRSGK